VRVHAWRRYAVAFVILTVITSVALQPLWGLTAEEKVVVRWVFAVLWTLMALAAYRGLRMRVGGRLRGEARIAIQIGLVVGLVAVVLVVLWLLGVSPSGIAVGGAVTGVVLGLAAQSTLGNFFAGAVLMAVHPYVPGDYVILRSWYWGGIEYRGRVADLNFFYTVIDDGSGRRFSIPNIAVAVATVTHLSDLRSRVPVPLPIGVNLTVAEHALTQAVAGATLAFNRFEADLMWVDVALPEGTQPAALSPWLQAVGVGATASPAKGT
jgi:small conductance mechanosensitive channel